MHAAKWLSSFSFMNQHVLPTVLHLERSEFAAVAFADSILL